MASLNAAQKALAAGSWCRADSAFRAVIAETSDPAAYEGLAQAAWWLDDADTCLTARETAYRGYRSRKDPIGAARMAAGLAWDCVLFGRGESVAMGWLGRAQETLAAVEECPEHGWCSVREAELALSIHKDPVQALACATRAAEVGRRTGDGDLSVVSLAVQGLSLVRSGEVEAGMARLDSAVAAATGGDVVDLMWMGKVLCWLIAACHETQDVTRAEEWCRRAEAICVDRDLVPLLNVCRIQYASVQVSAGTWTAAEKELTETLGRLGGTRRTSRLEAVVQLGELRRRQGRLVEAEALFKQAEFDPVAGLGRILIKFAVGDKRSAWTAVQRLLRALPTESRLARADVLLPAVRIAHAIGEDDEAAQAAAELRATAAAVRTDALFAKSAVADSVLAPPNESSSLLHEAVWRYRRAGLRHDEAEARLLLATSLMVQGDSEGARDQVTSATELMNHLADKAGLARAGDLQKCLDEGSAALLTPREKEVLQLISRGMSNDEIATALTLSRHTVHRHVANILAKLDQPTRASAVTQALTTGLI
ncbi:LuxR C-terminal-related transcriptional regulator [Phycicoccus sp. Root101]|uniref:helix-turn-helix transcriptional regulator n=1 Tax=Phycicoccus sp. Root101 TaxID=1736421 RepID=UPI000703B6C6|nr:LuxR C-terminal-related transcriptional regulator [Phycicoccus sp. Root101]KQU68945.1 transcriptional regulator [Phycicoccus sp. Root101]